MIIVFPILRVMEDVTVLKLLRLIFKMKICFTKTIRYVMNVSTTLIAIYFYQEQHADQELLRLGILWFLH